MIEQLEQTRMRNPTQDIDTDQHSPTSRLMLHILAAVAEFERDLIRERTAAGLADHMFDSAVRFRSSLFERYNAHLDAHGCARSR